MAGPPGPGHVTTGHRPPATGHRPPASLDMAKRNRDLGEAGPAPSALGRPGHQAGGPGDPARVGAVLHRVGPAQLACRTGVRAGAGERDAWPAVTAIALGSFALVFSEVIPVELLADISGQLGARWPACRPGR